MSASSEFSDDIVVTQVGGVDSKVGAKGRANFYFQCALRDQDLDGVSVFEGELTVDAAKRVITLGQNGALPGDAVRFTTIGRLQAANFTLERTPDIAESHISVKAVAWNDDAAKRFHGCFEDYRMKGAT